MTRGAFSPGDALRYSMCKGIGLASWHGRAENPPDNSDSELIKKTPLWGEPRLAAVGWTIKDAEHWISRRVT